MSRRDLFRLGRERRRLVARLKEVDDQLHPLIREGWREGLSFQDLADIVGMTRQRMHQIVSRSGYMRRKK